jgi:hypothetical protein
MSKNSRLLYHRSGSTSQARDQQSKRHGSHFRRNMLAAIAAGGLAMAVTAAGAQTGEPAPQPRRSGQGGTDPGVRALGDLSHGRQRLESGEIGMSWTEGKSKEPGAAFDRSSGNSGDHANPTT